MRAKGKSKPNLTDKELSLILSIVGGDRPMGLDRKEGEIRYSIKKKIETYFHGDEKPDEKLKLFNGRASWMRKHGNKLWIGRGDNALVTAFVAAYSVADAMRVIQEYTGKEPSRTEIDKHWTHGCWGDRMSGITPTRGMWLVFGYSDSNRPIRV